MHLSRLLPAPQGGPRALAQTQCSVAGWGQSGCARCEAPCMVTRADCGSPAGATSLSVHTLGEDMRQWKPWWPQAPAWPRIICFKWAPGGTQGVGREQRAGCQRHRPPCCVLHRAELGCGMNPASDTTVLQQWGQWQGTCKGNSAWQCMIVHHAMGKRNLHPDSSAPSCRWAWPWRMLLLAHQRQSCHSYMYIFDSNHTFLLLQKGSSVQNSYITQISLLKASTSVCRRMGKSSNQLKGSAIELSLAGALQLNLNQNHPCQVHSWPFRTE